MTLLGMNYLTQTFGRGTAYDVKTQTIARTRLRQLEPSVRYDFLRALYFNNSLYEGLARANYALALWDRPSRALRNPTQAVVEFYSNLLWPGTLPNALPIQTENDRIVEPIQKVWTWSGWASKKQVFARGLPMLGDQVAKVVTSSDNRRVYFELIEPDYVEDFQTDERGFLTYARIVIPQQQRKPDGTIRTFTQTEVWNKAGGVFQVYERDQDVALLDDWGTKVREENIAEAFGFNFLPLVWTQFRDVGEERGQAAVMHAWEVIDEANAQATRLAQNMFLYNTSNLQLVGTGMDKDGRAVPPPPINAAGASGNGKTSNDTIELGGTVFIRSPSGWKIEPINSGVDWGAHIAMVKETVAWMEKLLPELVYSRLSERSGGDLSGRAIRFMLAPAIARVEEARGNAEASLVRMNQMALTIAAKRGMPGFTDLGGAYEDGAFDHAFAPREVISLSDLEQAQGELARGQAAQAWQAAGLPDVQIWQRVGEYTEQEATDLANTMAAQQTDVPPGNVQQ